MNSVATELDYYAKKYHTQAGCIMNNEILFKLNDTTINGCAEKIDLHDLLSLITGGKISKKLKLKYSISIKRMLMAHPMRLLQATHLSIPAPKDTEQLQIRQPKDVQARFKTRKNSGTNNKP